MIKTHKHDAIFSKLVRARVNFTCEACGKYYPEGQRAGLHCSHLFSRRYASTRLHPSNAVAHCYSCHQRLGSNPVIFAEWIKEKIGAAGVEILRAMTRMTPRFRPKDYQAMYEFYKREWTLMDQKRCDGDTGRIEFNAPPEVVELERRARVAGMQ